MLRRRLSAVACLLLLTACAAGEGAAGEVGLDPGATVAPDTTPTDPVQAPVPDQGVAVGEPNPAAPGGMDDSASTQWTEVTPHPEAQGTPHAVVWEQVVTDPASDQVVIRWSSGVEPCTVFVGADVTEDASTVTVTINEASSFPDGDEVACIEIAQLKQYTVTLSEALGDRTVVDGAGR